MPTDRTAAQHILDLLAMPDETRVRAMMGEYVLYFHERVVGGIYDGRLLVKKTPSSERMLPEAEAVVPYPGAREMLAAGDPSNHELLRTVFSAMLAELPPPRPRKKRRQRLQGS